MADAASVSAVIARARLLARTHDRRIAPSAPLTRFVLRLPKAAQGSASVAIGVDLAMPINRAVSTGDRTALRLGPDEWLIFAPVADEAIPAACAACLPDGLYSLVDVSHRQTAISLFGPNAVAMLNALCPLDLDLAVFPVGTATRTVFAKADIVLWRTRLAGFHIEIWRSFAPYVIALLGEIGREYPD